MNIMNPIGMLSEFALQYGNKKRLENISRYVGTILGAVLGIDQNSP